jgi:hypothetical protein
MKFPYCPKCNIEFSQKLHRNFFFKNVFSWFPVRRFYCDTCKGSYYRTVRKTG